MYLHLALLSNSARSIPLDDWLRDLTCSLAVPSQLNLKCFQRRQFQPHHLLRCETVEPDCHNLDAVGRKAAIS